MSKSKKNTIDPDDIMGTYGADVARWFMLSDSPPERDVEWTERGVQGAWRFTQRLWRLVGEMADIAADGPGGAAGRRSVNQRSRCARPPTARSPRSSDAIEKLHFNVGVAHIYEFANALGSARGQARGRPPDFAWAIARGRRHPGAAVQPDDAAPRRGMLGRARPRQPGRDRALAEVEPELLIENTITLPVQINGKKRADVTVPRDAKNPEIEAAVLALDAVQTAARRQAPEEGDRRPAEDRQCGGLTARAMVARIAGPVIALTVGRPARPAASSRSTARRTLAGGTGLRQRLSSVRVEPDRRAERHAGGAHRGRVAQRADLRPDRRLERQRSDPSARRCRSAPTPSRSSSTSPRRGRTSSTTVSTPATR